MPETTDTPKKTKAPAKPRATAAAKDSSAKATTTRKASAKKTTEAPAAVSTGAASYIPTREEIARLAEQYWAERGHTDGQAEQDWLRAEQELMKRAS